MKWPLVKIFDLPNPEATPKRKIEVFPTLSFEIFKGSLGKERHMRRILKRFDRCVVGNVDVDSGAGFANPMNFFKKLDQILNVLEQVPAEYLVHTIVEKGKPRLRIADNVHPFTPNTVHANVTSAFDTTSSQIDLNGAVERCLRC